ncbi:uncharacterized protein DUF3224 [Propionibacteriaceae bacterium ES.041]|uniref:DUF3224 domain-containing protein n=1 Tax=Enemella evansiae TaxID=2016499 RepID=UPI000B9668AF|nr:DUF3224 domain-containing protein [Enemella evansiae]OYO01103.1 hypothetical protein CGZ96_04490 [Enemella evansiae]PFG68142.1 uncharacterized protein DUF3224 [Propionibacteriaceae bacterium ES.041]
MTPGDPLLGGTGRLNFTKTWSGGMAGTGRGVMISAGDPGSGEAGYVCFEIFEGSIDGHEGSAVLQQFGKMTGGDSELRYEVVPGSGTDELAGITGVVELTVDETGQHRVRLSYRG